jgi:Holliday junction resolvase RusA-like endonuclease
MAGQLPIKEAVMVSMRFEFQRPKSRAKDKWKTTAPDTDKLVRSIFDSLTGTVIVDDAQVVSLFAEKFYAEAPGVRVVVRTM